MEWMVSPTMMKNGYIRFYNRDGMNRMADLEFWDYYCVEYYEQFNALYNEAPTIHLKLSPGILRFRHIVFEKHWKETDLAQVDKIVPYAPQQEQKAGKEPRFIGYYITDLQGNKLEHYNSSDKILLNIETRNASGDKITVSLNDKANDFKHNGVILQNDTLKDYPISKDLEQVELEVVDQQN